MNTVTREPYRSPLTFFSFTFVFTGAISLMYLTLIWLLSESASSFLTLLRSQMGKIIINISVFLTLIFFLFVVILNINTLKLYLFLYDFVSKEQPASALTADEKFTMGYGPLLFASVVTGVIFLIGYFVQEESWTEALRIALVTIFPFLVALTMIGVGGIILILGLALLGLIINRLR